MKLITFAKAHRWATGALALVLVSSGLAWYAASRPCTAFGASWVRPTYDEWFRELPASQRAQVLATQATITDDIDYVPHQYRDAFTDSGTADEIALAEREVVRVLGGIENIYRTPETQTARSAALFTDDAVAARAAEAATLYAPQVMKRRIEGIEEQFPMAVGSNATWWTGFDRARFTVQRWCGVAVTDTGAYVQVLGWTEYHAYGQGWKRFVQGPMLQVTLLWADDSHRGLRLLEWASPHRPGELTNQG